MYVKSLERNAFIFLRPFLSTSFCSCVSNVAAGVGGDGGLSMGLTENRSHCYRQLDRMKCYSLPRHCSGADVDRVYRFAETCQIFLTMLYYLFCH